MMQFSRIALISTVFGQSLTMSKKLSLSLLKKERVTVKILSMGGNETHHLEIELDHDYDDETQSQTIAWLRSQLNSPEIPRRERIYPVKEGEQSYIQRNGFIVSNSNSESNSPNFNQSISVLDEDSKISDIMRLHNKSKVLSLNVVRWSPSHTAIPNRDTLDKLIKDWTDKKNSDWLTKLTLCPCRKRKGETKGNPNCKRDDIIKTYGPIQEWDISLVTDLHSLFENKHDVNEDITLWDTSNVTNMLGMIMNAFSFNQNIGKWKVSKVTDMALMFAKLEPEGTKLSEEMSFNQDLSEWIPSQLKFLEYMFRFSIQKLQQTTLGLGSCKYNGSY